MLKFIVACVLAALSFTPAFAAKTIHFDPGGRIDRYVSRVAHVRGLLTIDGGCLSACTMYLEHKKLCVTPRTAFGFHTAFVLDAYGHPHYSRKWTRILTRGYPPLIRAWILEQGGLSSQLIWLRSADFARAGLTLCK